ncbi:hypothetical protein PF010_g7619 [Phytophthora fragariae]|uniref:Uncharacterized protein n=1 Tax=Phytophthora fragariae TaxID=53985 RepID=A0A6G0LHX4_9STRA|nr:hypothetical protein PF010_g7619 [Phytophthora fragariae]
MLPKLSKARSVMFQTAEPESAFITARRNALLDLKNVSGIRISCAPQRRYVVEVFTDSLHCRTTTNTSSTTSNASNACNEVSPIPNDLHSQSPTVRVERGLDEFIDLRDNLYKIMFSAHHRQYCKFCRGVLDSVISGVDPGGFFFTLFGEERTARKLTKFVEDLVAPTLQHACANTQNCCSAQIWVPQAIHTFLFTENNSRR